MHKCDDNVLTQASRLLGHVSMMQVRGCSAACRSGMARTTALKPCRLAAKSCSGIGATGTQQFADQLTMEAGVDQRTLAILHHFQYILAGY